MSVSFKDLLSKPLDEVKKPPPLPAGTWFGVIRKHEFELSREKKTPNVRFTFGMTGPGEDIDPSSLDGVDYLAKTVSKTFWLTPDAEYRLKEFLEDLNISTTGRTFFEALPETVNLSVMMEITQRSSKDGKDIFNDVNKVTGVQ